MALGIAVYCLCLLSKERKHFLILLSPSYQNGICLAAAEGHGEVNEQGKYDQKILLLCHVKQPLESLNMLSGGIKILDDED